jgi:hypothetical protein
LSYENVVLGWKRAWEAVTADPHSAASPLFAHNELALINRAQAFRSGLSVALEWPPLEARQLWLSAHLSHDRPIFNDAVDYKIFTPA